jgi:hypothetical protein
MYKIGLAAAQEIWFTAAEVIDFSRVCVPFETHGSSTPYTALSTTEYKREPTED